MYLRAESEIILLLPYYIQPCQNPAWSSSANQQRATSSSMSSRCVSISLTSFHLIDRCRISQLSFPGQAGIWASDGQTVEHFPGPDAISRPAKLPEIYFGRPPRHRFSAKVLIRKFVIFGQYFAPFSNLPFDSLHLRINPPNLDDQGLKRLPVRKTSDLYRQPSRIRIATLVAYDLRSPRK